MVCYRYCCNFLFLFIIPYSLPSEAYFWHLVSGQPSSSSWNFCHCFFFFGNWDSHRRIYCFNYRVFKKKLKAKSKAHVKLSSLPNLTYDLCSIPQHRLENSGTQSSGDVTCKTLFFNYKCSLMFVRWFYLFEVCISVTVFFCFIYLWKGDY